MQTAAARPERPVRWNGRLEGGVLSLRAFLRFVQLTGPIVGPLLLRLGTWFALPLLPERRAGAEEFFTQLRGKRSTWPRRWLDTYRCFLTFTLCWFERLYVFMNGPGVLSCEVLGMEHVERACSAGRGLILLTAHFGNFELGAFVLGKRQTAKVNVVMIENEIPQVTALMSKVRGIAQPSIIAVNRSTLAALDLLAALRRGEILCIQGDRATSAASRAVSFLGRPAPFPLGPYQLAALARADVVPCFVLRTGPFAYRFVLLPPLDLRLKDDAAPECVYVRALEKLVLAHPYQWFNVFSFWQGEHAPQSGAA